MYPQKIQRKKKTPPLFFSPNLLIIELLFGRKEELEINMSKAKDATSCIIQQEDVVRLAIKKDEQGVRRSCEERESSSASDRSAWETTTTATAIKYTVQNQNKGSHK